MIFIYSFANYHFDPTCAIDDRVIKLASFFQKGKEQFARGIATQTNKTSFKTSSVFKMPVCHKWLELCPVLHYTNENVENLMDEEKVSTKLSLQNT